MSHSRKTLPLMLTCALAATTAQANGYFTEHSGDPNDMGITISPINTATTNADPLKNPVAINQKDIAIGLNANANYGGSKHTNPNADTANVAIGFNAVTRGSANVNTDSAIAIGKNANAAAASVTTLAAAPSATEDGIAIGHNAQAVGGGIHIGGNQTANTTAPRTGATSLGHNIENEGIAGTVVGFNSKIDTNAAAMGMGQGVASVITGAFNSIDATDASKNSNGAAIAVTGSLNQIKDSNGVTVMGSANQITGAYKDETLSAADALRIMQGDLTPLADKNLGSVSVIGGGNIVKDTTFASITGAHNNVSNSQDVFVAGSRNTIGDAAGATNSTIVMGNDNSFTGGSHNIVMGHRDASAGTVTPVGNLTNSIVLGSNYNVANDIDNSVVIGHSSTLDTGAKNAVAIGGGTKVSVEGGVALGQGSVANRAAITAADAYVPATADTAQTQAVHDTVKGNFAAVSVGHGDATRQITHVAAGSQDSDAVNVAQLKAVQQQSNSNSTAVTQLGGQLEQTTRDLRAGIAGASAIAFLQQPHKAGQTMVSVGVGGFRDATALAVGLAGSSADGQTSFRVGVGVNNRRDVNWGGSLGYAW